MRLVESHRIFLKLLDEGVISAGEDVEDLFKGLDEGDSEDQDLLEELRRASGKYDIAHFDVPRLRADLAADLASLEHMKAAAEPIKPGQDAKLLRLFSWLDEHPLLRAERLIIFTQFADTARYLERQLKDAKWRGVEMADSSRSDLEDVVNRFAAHASWEVLAEHGHAGRGGFAVIYGAFPKKLFHTGTQAVLVRQLRQSYPDSLFVFANNDTLYQGRSATVHTNHDLSPPKSTWRKPSGISSATRAMTTLAPTRPRGGPSRHCPRLSP